MNCPKCGAEEIQYNNDRHWFQCLTYTEGDFVEQDDLCKEREIHKNTRKEIERIDQEIEIQYPDGFVNVQEFHKTLSRLQKILNGDK